MVLQELPNNDPEPRAKQPHRTVYKSIKCRVPVDYNSHCWRSICISSSDNRPGRTRQSKVLRGIAYLNWYVRHHRSLSASYSNPRRVMNPGNNTVLCAPPFPLDRHPSNNPIICSKASESQGISLVPRRLIPLSKSWEHGQLSDISRPRIPMSPCHSCQFCASKTPIPNLDPNVLFVLYNCYSRSCILYVLHRGSEQDLWSLINPRQSQPLTAEVGVVYNPV